MLLAIAALPVTAVERRSFSAKIAEARRRIGHRDPDDVDILALAWQAVVPLWSNDNDFAETDVECYTTAELLRKLTPNA
jgi:predicted nucleic acid-binding protein